MKVMYKNDMKVPAKIWVDDLSQVESGALDQVENVCSNDFVQFASFMPDIHQGMGCPIGAVVATEHELIPNFVGVDIGCGMGSLSTNISVKDVSNDLLLKLVRQITQAIPLGFNKHDTPPKCSPEAENHCNYVSEDHLSEWVRFASKKSLAAKERLKECILSLGTLGGGNHFIELQKDENDVLHAMVHSGSRGPGEAIARVFMNEAKAQNATWKTRARQGTEFLPDSSDIGLLYLEAVQWAQDFAKYNREAIINNIRSILANNLPDIVFGELINIHHNYVAREHHYSNNVWVHRKGATRIRNNILGIIPGSMGTPSYLVKGLNNPESLDSCSHGAGRALSRSKARELLDLEVFKQKMSGIVSFAITANHLDESPMAYKDIDKVMDNQKDLVEIVKVFTPIASIKG